MARTAPEAPRMPQNARKRDNRAFIYPGKMAQNGTNRGDDLRMITGITITYFWIICEEKEEREVAGTY